MSNIVSTLTCDLKYLNNERFRVNFYTNATKPLDNIWFHFVFYYRFNPTTFSKFPIDVWENVCDWIGGKAKAAILNFGLGNILKYTSLNHSCPYQEVYANADNLTSDSFIVDQLFPAGKYRAEANVTDGYKKNLLANIKLIFSISDHRIEKF